jgi:hypothetical protein
MKRMKADESLRPWREIGDALGEILRPPFLVFGLLNAFLTVASIGITELVGTAPSSGDALLDMSSSLFIAAVSCYLQIAVVLVAASGETRAVDPWLKAAFRHRCFWRFLGVTFLMVFFVFVGLVFVVVGALVAGGVVALGQQAVILERKGPIKAINRSSELTKPVRSAVATVFAVFWLAPALWPLTAWVLDLEVSTVLQVGVAAVNSLLIVAGTVALTRVFVKLGGSPAPPLQTLLSKSKVETSA